MDEIKKKFEVDIERMSMPKTIEPTSHAVGMMEYTYILGTGSSMQNTVSG